MNKENIYTLFIGFRKLGEFKSIWKPRSLLEVVIWQEFLTLLARIIEIVGMYLNQRLKMMKIKDITGKSIEVTDLNKAIKQCKLCQSSLFLMESRHTVGENHTFMLRQLEELKRKFKT